VSPVATNGSNSVALTVNLGSPCPQLTRSNAAENQIGTGKDVGFPVAWLLSCLLVLHQSPFRREFGTGEEAGPKVLAASMIRRLTSNLSIPRYLIRE
jgi:hypothetical protein